MLDFIQNFKLCIIILISCICVIVYLGEAVQHIPPPEETDLGLDVRDGQES